MNFQKEIDTITDRALLEYRCASIKNRTHEDRLSAKGNIYFILSDTQLKYIGQWQAKDIKTRLDQHLFGKSFSVNENNIQNGTVSKWNKVEEELNKGKILTFKTILIEPDSFRKTIELELIYRLKPEWNIQGK
ncbi:hypothetical protein [Flavivirga jejuensis]|uniref:GIY-YIG domain-containing protein n=1 Tax=Flavivirga jejuensis TaxID=870487 RepID=A0ABT8WVB3_9FLAO|nr:hypothetical protein [Flavivirga jejuensis]MDO5977089.1 hypothetical protein [Flavivirga jejuensis]